MDTITATAQTVTRVAWAQTAPAGEFGEVLRGDEGTVVARQFEDDGDVAWLTVEFEAARVQLDVQPWDVDFIG